MESLIEKERYSRKDDQGCHQFLDSVAREKEWIIKREEEEEEGETSHGYPKLELRLGPPTGDWTSCQDGDHKSGLSLGHFPNNHCFINPVLQPPWVQSGQGPVTKESSQLCNRTGDKTNVTNTSSAQKRTAPGPVVGWPPIRSLRKNLTNGNSSKLVFETTGVIPEKVSDKKPTENCPKIQLVKINMDGIPIGRKVDLKAYDSYEKLSYAVDDLFRGLIAAQRDPSVKVEEEGGIVGGSLVNKNGEYTLVYEDNEGDRMLVGDVPWHMFVSTVKRLRVLRSSELRTLSRELGSRLGKEKV